jgi:hypothetical protein
VLATLCSEPADVPTGEALVHPQRGLGPMEWPDPDGTDFHQPPDGDPDEVRHFMKRGWAQKWPCEEVWVARRA